MFGKTNTSSGSKALHAAQHGKDGIDAVILDASQVTTGVFDIARIPQAALERCIVVDNDTARYALTAENVQVGDSVKVTETGKMWVVKDSANLSTDEGYIEYTASTNWTNISGKPESYTPTAHAASHAAGGADEITPGSIGAAPAEHTHTKAQVGLDKVDNTADAEKPVSTAQQQAIDAVQTSVNTHAGKTDNPHKVTKAQVGLENVEDGAQINVIEGVQVDGVDQTITSKKVNLTKATFGLDKVDNTADAEKPVSTAQQQAIDAVQTSVDTHAGKKDNPHAVTKAQVGLENVEDGAQINVIEGVQVDGVDQTITSKRVNLTKATFGLDKVDNTADADKPISTATQTALDGKVDDAEIVDMVHGLAPLQNVTVATDAWTKQSTPDVEEFTYRAPVTSTGVTADHYVSVVFNQSEASSGNYANVCQSADGVIYIYAKEQPTEAITLATVVAMKAA